MFDDRKLSNCSREYIPNEEVKSAFGDAVQMSNWSQVIEAVKQSEWLLRATLQKDAEGVAKGMDTLILYFCRKSISIIRHWWLN